MLATAPFRNRENRNSLLTLLPRVRIWGHCGDLLCAVILAPLYEELLFRVVLQGWLTSVVDPRYAIPIVALIFGAIHGLPDGIALLPLAGVLGYVFYRRHSYVSVLVIHGLVQRYHADSGSADPGMIDRQADAGSTFEETAMTFASVEEHNWPSFDVALRRLSPKKSLRRD